MLAKRLAKEIKRKIKKMKLQVVVIEKKVVEKDLMIHEC